VFLHKELPVIPHHHVLLKHLAALNSASAAQDQTFA